MQGTLSPQKVRHIPGPKVLTYSAGNVDSQPIPGGFLLREIALRLSFTVATSGAIASAGILAGSEWGLIDTISIKAGTETIREYSGEELRVLNMYWYKRFPRPRIALGGTVTAVDSTLMLPLWDVTARRPLDTALNTSNYGNLRLEVKWTSNAARILSLATSYSVTPTLDWSMETSTGAPATMKLYETRTMRLSTAGPTAAQTDFPIVLQNGLVAIRSLLVYAKDNTAIAVDLPGKITTVRLKSLNTNLIEATFGALRDQALARAKLTENVVSAAKVSGVQDSQFDLDNYLYLDFAKDGYLTETLPTFRISDLRLLLTTNAAVNFINVVANYLIPPTQ